MLDGALLPPKPDELLTYVNGQFLPDSRASISVLDHGLLFGDGCFDSWGGRNGFIYQLDAHLDRLYQSAEGLKIRNFSIEKEEMRAKIIETVHRNVLVDFYIKVLITRGPSPHPTIDPRKCGDASVIVYARPSQYDITPGKEGSGVKLKVLALRKLSHEGLEPRVKSLNYLNNVLGKLEAWDAGYDEGLFLDDRGYVCECPVFNILAVKGNTLFTPSRGMLMGITRGTVMEMAQDAGMTVEAGFYTVFDFTTADEVMMTNTVSGIVPVANIDGWPIGNGRPGAWTTRFQETYLKWLETGHHGTQVFPEAWR
jgi:branched-chain amino acid aminotransferase